MRNATHHMREATRINSNTNCEYLPDITIYDLSCPDNEMQVRFHLLVLSVRTLKLPRLLPPNENEGEYQHVGLNVFLSFNKELAQTFRGEDTKTIK